MSFSSFIDSTFLFGLWRISKRVPHRSHHIHVQSAGQVAVLHLIFARHRHTSLVLRMLASWRLSNLGQLGQGVASATAKKLKCPNVVPSDAVRQECGHRVPVQGLAILVIE